MLNESKCWHIMREEGEKIGKSVERQGGAPSVKISGKVTSKWGTPTVQVNWHTLDLLVGGGSLSL